MPIFISVTNVIIPKIFYFINKFESHSMEVNWQCSMYVKIDPFWWFNSSIALSIMFGFVDTIYIEGSNDEQKQGLVYAVSPIIIPELFTSTIIKLLGIIGIVRKHILTPRARTQLEMDRLFVSGRCDLSDIYSDATNVLFVVLFYSVIFSGALFLGSFDLSIQFCA